MEEKESITSFTSLFDSKKLQNDFKGKKRKKINLINYRDNNETLYAEPKKKKKVKNNICSYSQTQLNCLTNNKIINNCTEVTEVISKKELLPKTPEIFKSNYDFEQSSIFTQPFILKLLSKRSVDLNVDSRFIFNYKKLNREKRELNSNEKLFCNINKKTKNLPNFLDGIKEKSDVSKLDKKIPKKSQSQKNSSGTTFNEKKINAFKKSSSEDKTSCSADIYEVLNKKAMIFHLHHPCKFSFYGELKFTLITGEVEVLGFVLNDSSYFKSVEIFSPQKCTPMVVQSNIVKKNKTEEKIREILKNKLSEENIVQVLSNFQTNDSILLIEQINSIFGIVIDKFLNISLFPKELENFSSQSEWVKILQSSFNFTLSPFSKDFKKSCEWDKIPLSQCTVICGGKGVGKSTLLKYYSNKIISENVKVLYIDFDPGQSEFTPPGFLSAVIVDKPLLGPNFTHIKDGSIMVYFGNVDVSQNPSKYLECVKYIVNWCRNNKEISNMKWLVNTMGFCKGLGVELIISILKILKPTTVVQIWSSDNLNNYPFYLTSSTINNEKGFQAKASKNMQLEFDFRIITSKAEICRHQIRNIFSAKQLRNIMTLCYFSQMLSPPYYNFNAVKPYLISFSKLYLGVDFLISPNDILKAFNGNIVSLCHIEPSSEEILSTDKYNYFKIVIKPKIAPSYGMGFIRGIDCKKNKFYLITNVPLKKINNVNCLNLGRLYPPSSFFLKQDTIEVPAVYTSFSRSDTVQYVKRVFRFQPTQ